MNLVDTDFRLQIKAYVNLIRMNQIWDTLTHTTWESSQRYSSWRRNISSSVEQSISLFEFTRLQNLFAELT